MPLAVRYLEWGFLFIGAVCAGAGLGLACARWRLVHSMRVKLGKETILLVAGARLAPLADDGKPSRGPDIGLLMLIKNGLCFHSWLRRRKLFVAGPAITYIGLAEDSAGSKRGRAAVILRFLNSLGKEDGVYMKLMHPDRWVDTIKIHLIARPL